MDDATRPDAARAAPCGAGGHLPVLLAQALDGLAIRADGCYLDGTFGRGGHARALLARLGPNGRLLLMDKDPEAIAEAHRALGADARVAIVHGSFAELGRWALAADGLDGVLLDLGVSSPQLDDASRGFSFGKDGPLDMRMDSSSGISAAQWLARASEAQIADVLWTYGEERLSRRIAKALVAQREVHAQSGAEGLPFTRTAQLAAAIAAVVGRGDGRIHPATRSFQAIRIHINRELADLEAGLQAAFERLAVGGRLSVISFHSLEDRIVKRFIATRSKAPPANRRLPQVERFSATLRDVGGAQRAGEAELAGNPRARSATLRVAEKLVDASGSVAAGAAP